jgi:hypothetical protein
MRSEDERLSADAAERLAKYLAAQRNCDTRLAAEEVKKDAKLGAERIRAAGVSQEEEVGAATDAEPREPPRDSDRQAAPAAERHFREGSTHGSLTEPPDGRRAACSEERDVDLEAEVGVASG